MITFLGWILVFHILGIVLWIGSLLVSTHLMTTHSETSSAEAREILGRLEGKLFGSIAHPGAMITILSGALLISINPRYYLHAAWMHAKLALVVILIILDLVTYGRFKALRAGQSNPSRSQMMGLHSVMALVFIGILIMVIIKPFGG